jgi:hypothetical protein
MFKGYIQYQYLQMAFQTFLTQKELVLFLQLSKERNYLFVKLYLEL